MNKNIIINKLLLSRYSEKQAFLVAEELLDIDSSLSNMLLMWISESTETDVVVGDFSLIALKNKYKMTYPAALLTMNWLIKEPKVAIEAISMGIK